MTRSSLLMTALFTAAMGVSAPALAVSPTDDAPAAKEFKLPSQAEIDDMVENLPDFNGIMGDMLEVMQDEDLQKKLKSSAEGFKDIMEKTDLLENRSANGLPDINGLMATMLGAMSEDGPAGEMIAGFADLATEMEAIAEKHDLKPKTAP